MESRSSVAARPREDTSKPGSYSPGLRGSSRPRAPARKRAAAGAAPGPRVGSSRRSACPGRLRGRGERLDSRKRRVGLCPGLTNMGACGAAGTACAGPAPAALSRGRGARVWPCGRGSQDAERADRGAHRPGPHLGKSRPFLSASGERGTGPKGSTSNSHNLPPTPRRARKP